MTISIHALLAESDPALYCVSSALAPFLSTLSLRRATRAKSGQRRSPGNFYPRSPCGERQPLRMCHRVDKAFLSTLSLRRATPVRDVIQWEGIFLSTLSLRRATHTQPTEQAQTFISIHALLAESDTIFRPLCGRIPVFLSTLSLRRATDSSYGALAGASISIHALLAESDRRCFNALRNRSGFLSTLSLRRATRQRG